jgi:hypothetical protein
MAAIWESTCRQQHAQWQRTCQAACSGHHHSWLRTWTCTVGHMCCNKALLRLIAVPQAAWLGLLLLLQAQILWVYRQRARGATRTCLACCSRARRCDRMSSTRACCASLRALISVNSAWMCCRGAWEPACWHETASTAAHQHSIQLDCTQAHATASMQMGCVSL